MALDFVPSARFTVVTGSAPGQEAWELESAVIRVGALPANDIALDRHAEHVAPVHAKILFSNTRFRLYDNEDEFGTYVNGERIEQAVLKSGDELRFGEAGPVLRFEATGRAAELEGTPASGESGRLTPPEDATVLGGDFIRGSLATRKARAQELKDELTIGRARHNDVVLDHPQVSGFHARLRRQGESWTVSDNNSLNGTYVGTERVQGTRPFQEGSPIHVGPFLLTCLHGQLYVYDEREEAEIDVVDVTREVDGGLKLLDGISLRVPPGELVGLLGPSGAGKTTLLRALNGLRPATRGHVFINGVDLYQHYEHLKQSIGYVPQDDIIHAELTAERTLQYVSLLRLPPDTSPAERAERIRKILELLELGERKDVQIRRLSGGQRKRVSLGVELMTEPNLIFLDEPTAGLDPALESKMMVLFKELAQQGRTVVVTTHLMENVELFDKLVILVRGKLAFYGTPEEALAHFHIQDMRTIFGKIARSSPDEWGQAYRASPLYERYVGPVRGPAATEERERTGAVHASMLRRTRAPSAGAVRQLGILCRRYLEILLRDRRNTALLLLQAPIIACFVALALEHTSLILFLLSLSAIWFGVNNAAKEIVKELPVYRRERMVNLGLVPYVFSKVLVLTGLATVQCALLLLVVTAFREVPGSMISVFLALVLSSLASLLVGLTISSLVDSTDKANAVVPLVLIPQVLFAGVFTPLEGPTGYVSTVMPSRWSYDLLREVVLATHDQTQPPLVSYASKDEKQDQLARLDDQAQRLVRDIDRLAAKVPDSRDRVQRTWDEMRREIEQLREHRAAFQGAGEVSEQVQGIQGDYAAVEARLAVQRQAAEDLEEDFNWLQRMVAEISAGGEPDLNVILSRLDLDWVEQRRAQLDEVVASYQELTRLVERIGRTREPLDKERREAEDRAVEVAAAEQVLMQGQREIVKEVESMQRVAVKLNEHQEALKANARRVRELQAQLSDDLKHRRLVHMHPDDSVPRAAAALGVFCGVFLALTLVLQRRRDQED